MIGLSLRCLPLLHEHSQRDELLDILVDAGESAWDRGAHEVFEFLVGSFLTKVCFIDRNAIIHQCSYPFSSGSMDGRSLAGIYRSPPSGIVRHNMLEGLQFLLNQMQAFPVERSLLDIISRILG